jgi:hypothetical protein
MADLLHRSKLENDKTFALFLTQSDPGLIVPLLKERGFKETDYIVRKVPASAVEDYLYASDVGLSFVKATFATKSRSPTKIPEYLAAGLPVVANAGIGDVDLQLKGYKLGTVVSLGDDIRIADLNLGSYSAAELQQSARQLFDLRTIGGERYRRIYKRLV